MIRVRVIVTGGFHPLRVGHLRHFRAAKKLTDRVRLIVLVNSDEDMVKKYGVCAMPQAERMEIVGALRCVDEVVAVIDKDRTVAKTIRKVKPDIFAKGGDRTLDNLPESEVQACADVGCSIVVGVGEKASSNYAFLKALQEAPKLKYNPSKKED